MVSGLPKLLVVDANILFSFFKKGSARAQIIGELPRRGVKLISPDFVMEELFSMGKRVMQFSGIDELEFMFMFSLLDKAVESFPKSVYERLLPEANRLSPHGTGTKDDPYFALALSLNCPIWSDEKEFKIQSGVEIFSTAELVRLLGSDR